MRFIKISGQGAPAPAPVVYTAPETAPGERVHQLLVEARNQLARVGWIKSWGASGSGTCIMGAIGLALGIEHRFVSEVRLSVEGHACARALGFADVISAVGWNDRQWGSSAIFERLDAGIRDTAPSPADPFVHGCPAKAQEAENETEVDETRERELALA